MGHFSIESNLQIVLTVILHFGISNSPSHFTLVAIFFSIDSKAKVFPFKVLPGHLTTENVSVSEAM